MAAHIYPIADSVESFELCSGLFDLAQELGAFVEVDESAPLTAKLVYDLVKVGNEPAQVKFSDLHVEVHHETQVLKDHTPVWLPDCN